MMGPKEYRFGRENLQKILDGIELCYKCVSVTLGPNGRNVIIDLRQVIKTTKDGVSVLNHVESEDPFEEMGCKLIKEISRNCNDETGDATTTTAILAWEMCQEAFNVIGRNANVIKVKRGMEEAVAACVKCLAELSVPAKTREDYRKIAMIASQDGYIGDRVADIFLQSGKDCLIDIERADEPGIELEHMDGLSFKSGWFRPEFINEPEKARFVMEDCFILISDRDITGNHEIAPILDQVAKTGKRRLLVICGDCSGEALATLVINARRKSFVSCIVKAPSFGKNKIETLKDIAAATGGTVIGDESGIRLEKVTLEHLGVARKVTVGKERTIIVSEGHQQEIFDRAAVIKNLLDAPDILKHSADEDVLTERLASLTGGVSVIRVGGRTEVERHEISDRVEDAVRAVKAAAEEGMTPGGGTAYIRCLDALPALSDPDEALGVEIVRRALPKPALKVLEVAGVEGRELIVAKVREEQGFRGYSLEKGKIVDLLKEGVVDSCKVVRFALEQAVSCAMNFLVVSAGVALKSTLKDNMTRVADELGLKK